MAAEPSLDPSGPLALGPESCGHGSYGEQLQRALTKHREEARFRLLCEEAKLLPASDHRRVAFTNCDSMAATWITACPSHVDREKRRVTDRFFLSPQQAAPPPQRTSGT